MFLEIVYRSLRWHWHNYFYTKFRFFYRLHKSTGADGIFPVHIRKEDSVVATFLARCFRSNLRHSLNTRHQIRLFHRNWCCLKPKKFPKFRPHQRFIKSKKRVIKTHRKFSENMGGYPFPLSNLSSDHVCLWTFIYKDRFDNLRLLD